MTTLIRIPSWRIAPAVCDVISRDVRYVIVFIVSIFWCVCVRSATTLTLLFCSFVCSPSKRQDFVPG